MNECRSLDRFALSCAQCSIWMTDPRAFSAGRARFQADPEGDGVFESLCSSSFRRRSRLAMNRACSCWKVSSRALAPVVFCPMARRPSISPRCFWINTSARATRSSAKASSLDTSRVMATHYRVGTMADVGLFWVFARLLSKPISVSEESRLHLSELAHHARCRGGVLPQFQEPFNDLVLPMEEYVGSTDPFLR
jgi:hypothetical protein